MAFCRRCGVNFLDEHLNRDHLCADCAKALSAERRLSQKKERNRKKICLRCGDHGLFLYIDPEGYCENCRPKVDAERKKQRRAEQLAKNYQSCQNRTARPTVQRVYDSFHSKYPNALVTGLEPKDNDKAMVIYLEGGDEYNVVFNPLTNDVDVSKAGDAIAKDNPIIEENFRTDAPSKRKNEKSYGMAIFLSVLSLLYNVFLLLFSYAGGIVGVASSLVALVGGIAKSKTAIIFGACFLILSFILAIPYSFINLIFLVLLLVSA